MWSLVKIQAENLAAFQKLDYAIPSGVTTLVFGNNMDNDSQGSNGSGKSALLEAISIAITGEPLRKVKMEEIINDNANTSFIHAIFSNSLTREELSIARVLSRKEPQQIECHIYLDGEEIKSEETKQSGVSEYNKYILDKIGLTKDDIYNNFILSKHKFRCFLSSPDKDKKEIINRFSNAIIVDEAIAKLEEDLSPVQERLKSSELEVSRLEGSINAIQEQITQAKEDEQNAHTSKVQKKKELEDLISEKRKAIRETNQEIQACQQVISSLDEHYNKLVDLENDESLTLVECYHDISLLFTKANIIGLSNWEEKSQSLNHQLIEARLEHERLTKEVTKSSDQVRLEKKQLNDLQQSYSNAKQSSTLQSQKIEKDLKEADSVLKQASETLKNLRAKQQNVQKQVLQLENLLAGAISCPQCSHVFVLDPEVNVDDTKKQISTLKKEHTSLQKSYEQKESDIDSIEQNKNKLLSGRTELSNQLNKHALSVQNQSQRVNELNSDFQILQVKCDNANGKINRIETMLNDMFTNMFNEAYDLVENLTKEQESRIRQNQEYISTNKGMIETYEQSLKELEENKDSSLIDQLNKNLIDYKKKYDLSLQNKHKIEEEVSELQEQAQNFVEFKTHLANSKIDALSQMTNSFLEQIGSDIRIQFSGYTVLKSKKVRDKISISIIRNGVDCGSFDKFSEGEKARVNLANILAMHKLTNVNCQEGKGLDLLVLDEILEATDESGLANIFEALNSLQITSLVVSHGNIAENYPHKLVVNKQNGVSFINEKSK